MVPAGNQRRNARTTSLGILPSNPELGPDSW
jgi:hypothetical protein